MKSARGWGDDLTVVTVNFEEGKLTNYGKKYIARVMFDKGTRFLRAFAHLTKETGYEFVTLHLLCQGMEIVLKSYLLFANYDKYKPRLKQFGHNLEKLANACAKEFGVAVGKKDLLNELSTLNSLYKTHVLRYGYGSIKDILVNASAVQSGRVGWRLMASIRLTNHLLRKAT